MPRALKASGVAIVLAVALLAGAVAASASQQGTLARAMRAAGPNAGAYVIDGTTGQVMFRWRPGAPRILASNTKLFTSSAALARFGAAGTLGTEVRGRGALVGDGVFDGDLYLRGGGDPTFGSRRFTHRAYGGGATAEDLAAKLEQAGVQRVKGRVLGDETRFDTRRGPPSANWGVSSDVGPLSALDFNRGLATEGGAGFQGNPPLFAAGRLTGALKKLGVKVDRAPGVGRAPPDAEVLASVDSPPMARIIRLMNKPSDNFFAEMLVKDLALQANGRGTTSAGAGLAAGFARRLGAPARLADGSGLSRADRASPTAVARLLVAMEKREDFPSFQASLAVAGRDGTLKHRMRRGPARGRCHAKTGTLSNVSALSGYCRGRSGDTYVFSFLMNAINPYTARALQDRMAQALAAD